METTQKGLGWDYHPLISASWISTKVVINYDKHKYTRLKMGTQQDRQKRIAHLNPIHEQSTKHNEAHID